MLPPNERDKRLHFAPCMNEEEPSIISLHLMRRTGKERLIGDIKGEVGDEG